jgi:hypothetical protein
MADYLFQTVIQPDIPETTMTTLEWLVLGAVFEQETEDDHVYFYSSQSPNDMPSIMVAEALAALDAQPDVESRTADLVRKALASPSLDPHAAWLTLDLSVTGWAFIFQDIVRRCEELDHVSVITAWTCTRMRPDGFGGSAMVITAYAVRCKATDELVDEMLAAPGYGPVGVQPGAGVHALGRLQEDRVRWALGELLAAAPAPTFPSDAVSDLDIRKACLAVVDNLDLGDLTHASERAAARLALETARERAG